MFSHLTPALICHVVDVSLILVLFFHGFHILLKMFTLLFTRPGKNGESGNEIPGKFW